jgi:predicted nucleic acid-binding protein
VSRVGGYLLDTNIISETRKTRPFEGVVDFLAAADDEALRREIFLGRHHLAEPTAMPARWRR